MNKELKFSVCVCVAYLTTTFRSGSVWDNPLNIFFWGAAKTTTTTTTRRPSEIDSGSKWVPERVRKSERGRHKHTIFLFFFCCLGCGFSFRFHIYFTIYISYCKTFVDQLNYDDITWTYGIGDFSNTTTNFNSIRVIGNYFERGLF